MKLLFLTASISVVSALNGKVDTIHNSNYNPHGPSLYLKALLKYNIEPKHPGALPLERLIPHVRHLKNNRRRAADKTNGNGLSPEEPEVENGIDIYYLNPVTIGDGNTSQTFNLIFDTTNPDLWVFSDQLPPNEAGNNNHTLYKAGGTPTSKQVPSEVWTNLYSDGSGAGGFVYSDTINLGGISIPNAVVQAANFTTSHWTDNPGDGILGLSLLPGTPGPQDLPTTINQLANNTDLELPVFTALLTRSTETPGFFTFGYINETVVPGKNVSFIRVVEDPNFQFVADWTFPSEFALLNGKRLNRTGNLAICDTALPVIFLDTVTADTIYKTIPGAKFSNVSQGYIFPISNTQFPTLTIPAGNTEIALQSKHDFILAPAPEDGFVYGSIQDGGGNVDILGVPWLNNVYAVFDLGMTGSKNFRFGVIQREPETKYSIRHVNAATMDFDDRVADTKVSRFPRTLNQLI